MKRFASWLLLVAVVTCASSCGKEPPTVSVDPRTSDGEPSQVNRPVREESHADGTSARPADENDVSKNPGTAGGELDAIVDRVTSHLLLDGYFDDSLTKSGIETLARQDDWPLSRKLAWGFKSRYPLPLEDRDGIKALIKVQAEAELRDIEARLKLDGFIATYLESQLLDLEARKTIKDYQKTLDEFEVRLNDQLTDAIAVDIVWLAAEYDAVTTPEHMKSRQALKEAVRQAIETLPNAKQALQAARETEISEATGELRRSRKQVRQLIAKATQKAAAEPSAQNSPPSVVKEKGNGQSVAPLAEQVAEEFAKRWMLKIGPKGATDTAYLQEDFFQRALSHQPGPRAMVLAWCIARRAGSGPEDLLEISKDDLAATMAEGNLSHTLPGDVRSQRYNLKTSLMEAANDPSVALQLAQSRLSLSQIATATDSAEQWRTYAQHLVKTEIMVNERLTPKLAKQLVAAEASLFKTLSPEQAGMLHSLELLVHTRFTKPQAALTREIAQYLSKAETPELLASREKVKAAFLKVLTETPGLIDDFRHGLAIATKAETDELKAARHNSKAKAAEGSEN